MIEATTEIARIAAGFEPVSGKGEPRFLAKNTKEAAARTARGVVIRCVTMQPDMLEAAATIRYWWPGIRNDQHAIEVALRWMAMESRAGRITHLDLSARPEHHNERITIV